MVNVEYVAGLLDTPSPSRCKVYAFPLTTIQLPSCGLVTSQCAGVNEGHRHRGKSLGQWNPIRMDMDITFGLLQSLDILLLVSVAGWIGGKGCRFIRANDLNLPFLTTTTSPTSRSLYTVELAQLPGGTGPSSMPLPTVSVTVRSGSEMHAKP